MAKRKGRDYKKEYEQRNKRAKERGYSGYSELRKVKKEIKEERTWKAGIEENLEAVEDRSIYEEYIDAYYQAFLNKENEKDYSLSGAKARYFVFVTGLMSSEEWSERYPNGIRGR